MANLDEHKLLLAQLFADPLALNQRGGIVFDVGFNVLQGRFGHLQGGNQRVLLRLGWLFGRLRSRRSRANGRVARCLG
jgi:hypothetical protein